MFTTTPQAIYILCKYSKKKQRLVSKRMHNGGHIWAKSKTSVFATDGIWLTFSVVLNFLLLGWTPWVGFQNEQLMCFHNRQKRNCHSWTCCYSNTICKCDGRNRLFHFFRPSHFKDCIAIAMCLIVALFFPFLIEVYWLLYCVVYSLCKITQLEKQDNRKCIFATSVALLNVLLQ